LSKIKGKISKFNIVKNYKNKIGFQDIKENHIEKNKLNICYFKNTYSYRAKIKNKAEKAHTGTKVSVEIKLFIDGYYEYSYH
jgi:hypothetical protein